MENMAIKIFSIVILVSLIACNETSLATDINQEELLSRLADQSTPVILDVRSSEEYNLSHIPGAINIPYKTFSGKNEILNIDKKSEIVVYCETGGRAGKMLIHLEKNGFFEARLLKGHMRAWREAGLLTE